MVISRKRTWTGSLNKALWELLLHVWARLSSVRRFPGGASGNNPPANAGTKDSSSTPGSGRPPGVGILWHSCLENAMDRGAWQMQSTGSQSVGHGTRSWAVPWIAWPWVRLWAGGLDFSLCFQRNRSPTWQGHWGPWPEWSRAGGVQVEQTSCSFFLGNILAFDTTFLLVIINCFGWTFRYEVSNSTSVLTNYFCYLFVPLEQVFSSMMLLTFFFLYFFFKCWPLLKSYWLCYNIVSVFCLGSFCLGDIWELSSPARNGTYPPALEGEVNCWTTGEVTYWHFKYNGVCCVGTLMCIRGCWVPFLVLTLWQDAMTSWVITTKMSPGVTNCAHFRNEGGGECSQLKSTAIHIF